MAPIATLSKVAAVCVVLSCDATTSPTEMTGFIARVWTVPIGLQFAPSAEAYARPHERLGVNRGETVRPKMAGSPERFEVRFTAPTQRKRNLFASYWKQCH